MPKSRKTTSLNTSAKASAKANTATTKNTGNTSPYDRAFGQHLIDHGIYPEDYDAKEDLVPSNLAEIVEISHRARRSLSPSVFTAEDFQEIKKQKIAARKEQQATELARCLGGKLKRPYTRSGGIRFTNLAPLTDGSITPGNPDIFYGSYTELLSAQARVELRHLIIPSTEEDHPALPNFTVAVKGPGGSIDVAKRQARYDGALCARAMETGNRLPDGNAYAITCVYHPDLLTMYTSHPHKTSHRTEYLMTAIDSFALSTQHGYVAGATAYRNLRDWAEEQRLETITRINERFSSRPEHISLDDALGNAVRQESLPKSNSPQRLAAEEAGSQPQRSSRRKRKHGG